MPWRESPRPILPNLATNSANPAQIDPEIAKSRPLKLKKLKETLPFFP
jgi:hypothetical protein